LGAQSRHQRRRRCLTGYCPGVSNGQLVVSGRSASQPTEDKLRLGSGRGHVKCSARRPCRTTLRWLIPRYWSSSRRQRRFAPPRSSDVGTEPPLASSEVVSNRLARSAGRLRWVLGTLRCTEGLVGRRRSARRQRARLAAERQHACDTSGRVCPIVNSRRGMTLRHLHARGIRSSQNSII
jgi:hypothetical protein